MQLFAGSHTDAGENGDPCRAARCAASYIQCHGGRPILYKAKLKNKGDKKIMNNGPLVVMKYQDRKDVVVLSSGYSTKRC